MPELRPDEKKENWKKHLLSSGMPLEYEVAHILAVKNMAISADYCYLRSDGAHKKEFSVDIEATFRSEDGDGNIAFVLHTLVECKYRSRDKFLLYARDPNLEFPSGTLGGTVSQFDTFVPLNLPLNAFVRFEEQIPYVYKGVELSSGGNVEKDVRQGIEQLRYATPQLLRDVIDFTLLGTLDEERAPFFVARILVTNVPIKVLKEDLTIQDIENSNTVNDVSDEADVVVLCSDYGPDYEAHFLDTFKKGLRARVESARSVELSLIKRGVRFDSRGSPSMLIRNLANANRFELFHLSSQFLLRPLQVCQS